MSLQWLKNNLGAQLSDEEFADIPNPSLELHIHVILKMIQAGSLLGAGILGPVFAAFKKETRNLQGIMKKSARFGRNGIIVGVVAAPFFTHMKIKDATVDGVKDRDFRLRHNRAQVRVDQASLVGAVAGAGITAMTGYGPAIGAMWGVALGVVDMAVYNNCYLKSDKKSE